jgi:hypothetical protein
MSHAASTAPQTGDLMSTAAKQARSGRRGLPGRPGLPAALPGGRASAHQAIPPADSRTCQQSAASAGVSQPGRWLKLHQATKPLQISLPKLRQACRQAVARGVDVIFGRHPILQTTLSSIRPRFVVFVPAAPGT